MGKLDGYEVPESMTTEEAYTWMIAYLKQYVIGRDVATQVEEAVAKNELMNEVNKLKEQVENLESQVFELKSERIRENELWMIQGYNRQGRVVTLSNHSQDIFDKRRFKPVWDEFLPCNPILFKSFIDAREFIDKHSGKIRAGVFAVGGRKFKQREC